jgi:hypothetical protein
LKYTFVIHAHTIAIDLTVSLGHQLALVERIHLFTSLFGSSSELIPATYNNFFIFSFTEGHQGEEEILGHKGL